MACNKKGPCKEEKSKNVEKLTDEKLDEVSGGTPGPPETWPQWQQVPLPFGNPTVMPPVLRYCSPSESTDPFRRPGPGPSPFPSFQPFGPPCKPVLPSGWPPR